MKTLRVTWKGITPLIMHSCKCVNPLHPIAKELKKYTSKKNKTEEDLNIISDLEWKAGAYWDDLYIPFNYGENLTLDELVSKYEYRDTRPMNVQRSKVIRTRPRFDQWNITFTLVYNEDKIDLDTIVNAIEYAGQYVGLCDSRPKYGKFVAIVEEVD